MIGVVLGVLVFAVITELAIILASNDYKLVRGTTLAALPTLVATPIVALVAAYESNWSVLALILLGAACIAIARFILQTALYTLRNWNLVS